MGGGGSVAGVFIVSVNVLFLSNSQQVNYDSEYGECSEQSEVCWAGRLCLFCEVYQ